jgi:hypothetical protein
MKLIALLVFAILCTAMGSKPIINPRVVVDPIAVDNQTSKPFLTVTNCDNCSVAEFDRITASAVKLNEVVLTQCFRDQIEGTSLIQTNGKTPQQVVDSLLHADVRIEAQMYWTAKRVLGYTIEGVDKEWINRRYMMSWSVCDLTSLLGHESSHKVGYDHDYYPTNRRPNSVPYAINRAIGKCCQ